MDQRLEPVLALPPRAVVVGVSTEVEVVEELRGGPDVLLDVVLEEEVLPEEVEDPEAVVVLDVAVEVAVEVAGSCPKVISGGAPA